MLADAVAEAAAEVHELRSVAASAARLVRHHQHSQRRANERRLLTVLLVYHITGHMGWCMMAATALGIAELYVAGTGTEASPPQPQLPFLGADVWEPRAVRLLTLWPVPLPVEKAGRLIAELRVLGFLAEATARGVAVSTPHLAALLRRAWPLVALGHRARKFLLRLRDLPRVREAWARQFRVRWDVRWRRLPMRPLLRPEDVRRRARHSTAEHTRGARLGPKCGAVFRPRMSAPSCTFWLGGGSERGTENGPIKWPPS